MSNKGKYKGSFISAEELKRQESLEATEFSRDSNNVCHRRRIRIITSKLLKERRMH